MFSMQSVTKNPLIATFKLLSAASLNLGCPQNGVIGNGLRSLHLLLLFHLHEDKPFSQQPRPDTDYWQVPLFLSVFLFLALNKPHTTPQLYLGSKSPSKISQIWSVTVSIH